MTDRDNLRDRIAKAVMAPLTCSMGFVEGPPDGSEVLQVAGFVHPAEVAQAIIDEFGLTVRGDGCGYHEIYGSYDTRFEN